MSAVLAEAPIVTRTVPLSDAVEFNPKPERGSVAEELEVSFVPMAAVEAGSGRMNPTQPRPYSDVKKGFTYFRDGDVLFAKSRRAWRTARWLWPTAFETASGSAQPGSMSYGRATVLMRGTLPLCFERGLSARGRAPHDRCGRSETRAAGLLAAA